MTAHIRPWIIAAATVTTLLAALFLVTRPATATPVAPTATTALVTPASIVIPAPTPWPGPAPVTKCFPDGGCTTDESTSFSMSWPTLPGELVR